MTNTPATSTDERRSHSQPSPDVVGAKVPARRGLRSLAASWQRASANAASAVFERFVVRRKANKFYMLLGGHIYFKTLSAAVELGLFEVLHDRPGLSTDAIAEALKIQCKPARILLLGVTTLGLTRKSGDSYTNSRLVTKYLLRGSSKSLVPIVRWQNHINYQAMFDFELALRENTNVGLKRFPGSGPTLYERLAKDAKLEQIFQDAMSSISTQANQIFAQYADLTDVRFLLDVGGGDASNIIALAQQNPSLRAAVFDSPTVCKIATVNIDQQQLQDRLSAIPGDCFIDPFPANSDCILFSHFLTIWSEDQNRELLRKAYDALRPGGRVMVFNMMQNDSGDGPLSAALGSPYFLTLATGNGMIYTWSEYESWFATAGFQATKRHQLPRDHGLIIGIK